jgi:long-subunit acyl-CoA synthetase (AMP-forming)
VRRFRVLAVQWSQDTKLVTASLKLRRAKVLREHRHDVEALYS